MRAAVIHVLAFLSLCGDRATIMGTHLSRPAKAKACFLCFAYYNSVSEYILNLIRELPCNQRLMSAFVLDFLPNEISQAKTVVEDRFEIRARRSPNPFGVVPSFSSSRTYPTSSSRQYQLDRHLIASTTASKKSQTFRLWRRSSMIKATHEMILALSDPVERRSMNTCLKMLLFGALLLCAATSLAQVSLAPLDAKHLASIDDFVNHEMARQRIPGLELGIYSRGRILLAKGYGLANVELNVPVKPETIMQSGSVGKQFVSAAIMMLVEEAKSLSMTASRNSSPMRQPHGSRY